MKKNIISVFFAMSLSAVLLTGCGKNHTHSFGEWKVETPATHTSVGTEIRICECGESEEREIPKTSEHEWGEWVVVTPATHTSVGLERRTCECGESEEREIPKTSEHEWGEWVVVTPATHTSVGLERRTCECGESEEREIPKTTEHSYEITTTPAGYLTDGSIVYTCECGDTYTETIPSIQSTIDSMEITDFDPDTLLAEVTVTFIDESSYVFEGLSTEVDANDEDLYRIQNLIANLSIIKSVTGYGLKDAKDFFKDVRANCSYEYHFHRYVNGVCRCGDESFRFVIKDIFSITGTGVVLTGTVEGKAITIGDKVQKYDATTETFVEYTISKIEAFSKELDVAEPGTSVGISFEETPEMSDFSRGMSLVTEEGNWTPIENVSGIIHLPYKHNPMFDSYRPQFYCNGMEVTGVVTLPSELELLSPGEMATVSVEFANPILMLNKTEFVVREGGRTSGFFVVGYEEDELGTFVPAVSVKYPSTPGATPTNHTLVDAYYTDEDGNAYNDLALLEELEEVEINNPYDYFIGIKTSLVLADTGTAIISDLTPYDNLGVEWVISSNQDEDNVLLNKKCTLITYDSDTNTTVENEYIIDGAVMPTEGSYVFLIRGLSSDEGQKVIAMYIAS